MSRSWASRRLRYSGMSGAQSSLPMPTRRMAASRAPVEAFSANQARQPAADSGGSSAAGTAGGSKRGLSVTAAPNSRPARDRPGLQDVQLTIGECPLDVQGLAETGLQTQEALHQRRHVDLDTTQGGTAAVVLQDVARQPV